MSRNNSEQDHAAPSIVRTAELNSFWPALVAVNTYEISRIGNQQFDDARALQTWLSIFDHKNRATARHYRTQVGKFMLFLRLVHPDWDPSYCLKLATEQDVAAFEMALSHKAPATGPRGSQANYRLTQAQLEAEGLSSQPFAKSLAKSSISQALSVLNAMYEFLRQPNGAMTEPYVTINPVKRVRKSATRNVAQTDRHIPLDGVQAMHACILSVIEHARASGDQTAVQRYERKLWIFALLFGLWGRREEISKLSMGDFVQQHDGAWRANLSRKGGKEESLPVAGWVMDSLRRYRTSLGLPRAWAPNDGSPAIGRIRSRPEPALRTSLAASLAPLDAHQHITDQVLYLEVKSLANETADEVALGMLLPDIEPERREMLVERLRRCSPHWFRHTGPTIAINNGSMTIEHASKMLGHSNLATTSQMYYHADDGKTRSGLDSLGSLLTQA